MNGQDPLIEPMSQSTSNNDMNNLYIKPDFLPTSINHNTSSSTTTIATATNTTTMTNNNNFNNNYTQHPPKQQHQQHQHQHQQQQQTKGYPLIAPFQRTIFQNFDLSSGPPPPPQAQPPQISTAHFHKNDLVQFNTNKSIATTTPASEIINASVAMAAQSVIGFPDAQTLTTSNSVTTGETTTTTYDLQTPKSSSEQSQALKPKVKITGDNVTSATIEEGYVQFVLEHDATYISDGIDSLVYAKRKFQSVPKTGDISYTTWDIYQLVLKLHKQEVGQQI